MPCKIETNRVLAMLVVVRVLEASASLSQHPGSFQAHFSRDGVNDHDRFVQCQVKSEEAVERRRNEEQRERRRRCAPEICSRIRLGVGAWRLDLTSSQASAGASSFRRNRSGTDTMVAFTNRL